MFKHDFRERKQISSDPDSREGILFEEDDPGAMKRLLELSTLRATGSELTLEEVESLAILVDKF